MSVTIYQLTRHNIPEDVNLHQCHCENLKSYIVLIECLSLKSKPSLVLNILDLSSSLSLVD